MITAENRCPACGQNGMTIFFEVANAPLVCNVLWDSRAAAASAARGSIRLAHCSQCDMICNVDFDAHRLEYTQQYENSLDYSPKFQAYVAQLADRLVRRFRLYGKDIIEIGCGQGRFLGLMARIGGNRGVGYDPSYDPVRGLAEPGQAVQVHRELFDQAHASGPADLICCRQVLEHIAEPIPFLRSIARAIASRPETIVFFEVPNVLYTLKDMGIWDIIYEHCSYFSPGSLGRLFVGAGFELLEVAQQYDGQFITVEARLRGPGDAPSRERLPGLALGDLVGRFRQSCLAKMNQWRRTLCRLERLGRRAVVWGAGSKGITFLNAMDVSSGQIEYVVDLNPHKHGRYLTGTGQRIVPPEFLRDYQPRVIIVMNPLYQSEIRQAARRLGLQAEFLLA